MSNNKPWIFIVTKDKYPPFRVDIAELYLRYLVVDYRMTFLMDRDNKPGQEPKPNADIDYMVPNVRSVGLRHLIGLHIRGLKRVLREKPDIIQCRDTMIVGFFYLLASLLIRRPFVYWMSYPMELSRLLRAQDYLRQGKLGKALPLFIYGGLAFINIYGVVLRGARHIFVQSEQMKADVAAFSITREKMTAVPMGVNLDLFNAETITPPGNEFYKGRRSIFYSGSLDPARRMSVPAEAVARFIAKTDDVIFVIAGSATPHERAPIIEAMKRHGVEDRLVILDHMPLDEMLSHVKCAWVCLAPYATYSKMLRSSTPTKLVEYLAMGKRVVANHHPDQTFLLASTGLGILTDFTVEGFEQAFQTALGQGEPVAGEIAHAKLWIADNRSYEVLSRLVSSSYRKLMKDRGVC